MFFLLELHLRLLAALGAEFHEFAEIGLLGLHDTYGTGAHSAL